MKRESPALSQWNAVLCAELRARLGVLVQRMRSPADAGAELAFRGLVIGDAEVDRLLGASAAGAPQFESGSLWRAVAAASAPRAAELQRAFRLSDFEMECVLACLAPELDRELERIYAYLNDDVTQRQPSIDLLLRLLALPAARLQLAGALARDARLLRHAILVPLEPASGSRHAHGAFARVADGVARFLLGQDGEDALLGRARCIADAAAPAPLLWSRLPVIEELAGLLRHQLAARRPAPLVVVLRGRAGSGRQFAVETACERAGRGCIALDLARLRRSPDAERSLAAAFRDSVLRGAPLFLHHLDAWLDEAERAAELRGWLQPLAHELGRALVLGTESGASLSNWFRGARMVEFELPELTVAARSDAWKALLAAHARLGPDAAAAIAEALAAKFRLTHGEIAETFARAAGARELPREANAWSKLLHQQAARVAAPRLGQLAQLTRTAHGFRDLVLPPEKLESLREIVRRVRHRRTVMEQWGFGGLSARGRGLVALFFGPSGTGKTMAAEVVAHELDMQLFRIDLAGVVSKYIGETEKNLRAVFEEADRADAVLFFDEADALFGKRSEVKDAHDRYANIEIDYLLQRIESFEGVAILATNMRGHLDPAFLRRIHVTVEFALPQTAERLGLWQRSFPAAAPRGADVDWDFLAGRFELSGGAIRSAAFGAAFLAAEGTRAIGMAEIVRALHGELAKAGRRVAASEFGRYAHHLQHRPSP